MTNPYAPARAAPSTPEEQRVADYEAAIGPNAGYYLQRFEDFDAGGSKLGWHWPAFFATSGWFVYRKMWAMRHAEPRLAADPSRSPPHSSCAASQRAGSQLAACLVRWCC